MRPSFDRERSVALIAGMQQFGLSLSATRILGGAKAIFRRSLTAATGLLDKLLASALVLLLGTMVLVVSWQVASRYLLASPSSWTEEVARFELIWIGLLGAAYAFRTHSHIALDALAKRLVNSSVFPLAAVTMGLSALFALLVLVIGGGSLMLLTIELHQTSPALGLPMAVVYAVIPVAGLLILLFALAELAGAGPDGRH